MSDEGRRVVDFPAGSSSIRGSKLRGQDGRRRWRRWAVVSVFALVATGGAAGAPAAANPTPQAAPSMAAGTPSPRPTPSTSAVTGKSTSVPTPTPSSTPVVIEAMPSTSVMVTAMTPIEARYARIGGVSSALGQPVGAPVTSGAFQMQEYTNGRIYWSPATGAHELYGAILQRYLATGGPTGPLGLPVATEVAGARSGVRVGAFQGGRIYWSSPTGAHEVYGAILQRYQAIGGEAGPLGLPVSGESDGARGGVRISGFQGGRIYWSSPTGAHEVYGAILQRYQAIGGELGPLGLPVSGEGPGIRPNIRISMFQGGRIYWSAPTAAHEVYGAILQRYLATGGDAGPLGLPVSGEVPGGRAGSRISIFQGGRIYWSGPTGAQEVYGAILQRYLSVGAENSFLALPTSGETPWQGGRSNSFQGGRITWNAATGQTAVMENGSSLGVRAMNIALGRRGAPYVWGGQGPWGFDCSGLVSYAFKQAGYNLPSGSSNQYNYGYFVSSPAPGDLVFYGYRGSQHVAIYIGNGQVVQASNYNTGVHVASVWYIGSPVAYKRIG